MGKPEQSETDRSLSLGTLYAFFAYLLWGFMPFYWKWLGSVSAVELFAHRVVWAAVLAAILVLLTQRRELRRALSDRRAVLVSSFAGILVGANWLLYVWAVTNDHLVESSLGYYINPLVSVLLGIVILRERLTRLQLIALLLAAAGVLVLTISHGSLPWISVGLASSFAVYGLVKKTSRLNALTSLMVEMTVVSPIAIGVIVWRAVAGSGSFVTAGLDTSLLLVGTGLVTVAPLLLFGAGARRIPLSRVGFLQYIAPTLMLLIGTVVYREPFTKVHAMSFACIWTALAIYTASLVRARRRIR
jgi:chloramphenicol-sensitive protein RarD